LILQYGQISSDGWRRKGVNNDQKMLNICVNLPSGKSVFCSVHPVSGHDTLDNVYLKRVMLNGAKEVTNVDKRLLQVNR